VIDSTPGEEFEIQSRNFFDLDGRIELKIKEFPLV
jgi:hypothetical protein